MHGAYGRERNRVTPTYGLDFKRFYPCVIPLTQQIMEQAVESEKPGVDEL